MAQKLIDDGLENSPYLYLGCKVVGSTAQCPCRRHACLRKSEIGHFDVAILVEKDVLRLQIAVDDVETVKMVEGQCNFSGIKFGDRIRKTLHGREYEE